jgi:hypothetical protein
VFFPWWSGGEGEADEADEVVAKRPTPAETAQMGAAVVEDSWSWKRTVPAAGPEPG